VPATRTAAKISTALLVLATMMMAHVRTALSQSTALHNPVRSVVIAPRLRGTVSMTIVEDVLRTTLIHKTTKCAYKLMMLYLV
jgi:hypothetical protein